MKIKGWVIDTLQLATGTVAMRGGGHLERVDWLDAQLLVRSTTQLWSRQVRGYVRPLIRLNVMTRSQSDGVTFSPVLEEGCRQRLARFYDMGGRGQLWRLEVGTVAGSSTDVLSVGVRALLVPAAPQGELPIIRLGKIGRLLLA